MSYTFETNNEFNTEYFANLLKKDEKRMSINNNINVEIEPEIETVQACEAIDNSSSAQELLDNNTTKGLPFAAIDAIRRVDQIKANLSNPANQSSQMFSKLFDELNQKYGLVIRLDKNSSNLIIEPGNEKAVDYYVSEACSRSRSRLYFKYLNAINILSDRLLAPEYIQSESISHEDITLMVSQLLEFMKSLNEIYKEVHIPDAELKLEKLSEKKNDEYNIHSSEIREFLDFYSKLVRGSNKN